MNVHFRPKTRHSSPLHVFTIALPVSDNAGKSFLSQHNAFQDIAKKLAGGYTKHPAADGVWLDPKTGVCHVGRMVPYELAVPELATKAAIIDLAFGLFKDQKALFVKSGGVAEILERGVTTGHEGLSGMTGHTGSASGDATRPNTLAASIESNTAIEPFSIARAKRIYDTAEDKRILLSHWSWELSEALRHWRENEDGSVNASLLQSVQAATNNLDVLL